MIGGSIFEAMVRIIWKNLKNINYKRNGEGWLTKINHFFDNFLILGRPKLSNSNCHKPMHTYECLKLKLEKKARRINVCILINIVATIKSPHFRTL